MACNCQVSVKDEASAKQWLSMVQKINEDYFTAMKDAADALTSMQDFCEGTLVDEFVAFGDSFLDAARKTFEAVDAIADTVNSILDTVKNFTEDVVGGITGVVKKILG